MSEDKHIDGETLELAKKYVGFLEVGDAESADNALAELTDIRESQLFNELGRLTRDFHETLNSFSSDDRFSTLAQDDIPDARERLNFVITKTDDAAHRTLNAVESALPLCETLEDSVGKLNTEWEKFLAKEMKPQEFRDLSLVIKEFFSRSGEDVRSVRNDLNDILMAQDFQDITGQIIKRVITLVTEVESSLVELVKVGSKLGVKSSSASDEKQKQKHKEDPTELAGPQVPGMESETIVASQDDVDDLLSSLGF
ncbi:MAG: protein phosphatase CheZ [Gammaproteobacteria bacterium]|nr:protein phosphatase CheZ [Gammaproteobacteria bacterium]